MALTAVVNDHYCKESNDTYRAVCGGEPPAYVPYSTLPHTHVNLVQKKTSLTFPKVLQVLHP